MDRVLLVNMPFGNVRWPSLGLGLLKAELERIGIACDVANFNFDFAELVGLEHYLWLADHFAFVLGGERLFAKHYFPERLPSDADYSCDVLLGADPRMTDADRAAFFETERHIPTFLDACMAQIDWAQYDIVGFSVLFQQTMPSLCLARQIKQVRPEVRIVFGGAACEGLMGAELQRQFPEIDCVFSGEADRTFPEAVQDWLNARCHDGTIAETEARIGWQLGPIDNLDTLPCPNFDDYFARLAASPLCDTIEPILLFETSRGCWWRSEKHCCAFCGLNGERSAFRSKSPSRAIEELHHLVDRYGVHRACAADNVFNPRYFKTLLPMMENAGLDLSFVYEMRGTLNREQIKLLCDAGLEAAQLGVESFSTPLLRRMSKGVTAMQNLQSLRWLSGAGIDVKWNLLYGIPGEEPGEYAKIAELLPSLYHLCPPQMIGRIRVDRFSRYFEDPEEYGIVNVRANRAFRYVYPFSEDVLDRLAYYFEYDYANGRDWFDYVQPVVEAVERWQELAGTVAFRMWDRGDGVLILTDTRPGAAEFQRRLTGIERMAYLFCDEGQTPDEVAENLAARCGSECPDQAMIVRMLDQWVSARLMACLDGRYLSLATKSES